MKNLGISVIFLLLSFYFLKEINENKTIKIEKIRNLCNFYNITLSFYGFLMFTYFFFSPYKVFFAIPRFDKIISLFLVVFGLSFFLYTYLPLFKENWEKIFQKFFIFEIAIVSFVIFSYCKLVPILVTSIICFAFLVFYRVFLYREGKKLNKVNIIPFMLLPILAFNGDFDLLKNSTLYMGIKALLFFISFAFLNGFVKNQEKYAMDYLDFYKNVLESLNQGILICDQYKNIVYKNNNLFKENNKDSTVKNYIKEESLNSLLNNSGNYIKSQIFINRKLRDALVKEEKLYNSNKTLKGDFFIVQKQEQLVNILNKLLEAKDYLEKEISKKNDHLKRKNKKLKKQIINKQSIDYQLQDVFCYDDLTGLYNREYFKEEGNRILKEEKNKIHGLIIIDLDNFKEVNDSLGHGYGDDVIVGIANKIRREYKYKNVLIARFGGDEFGLLFRNIKGRQFLEETVNNILEIIKEPIYFDTGKVHITGSIGICLYPYNGARIEELIKNADTAMYKAKEDGRNGFKFFEKQFNDDIKEEYEITNNLINAIENDELMLYYQPQVVIRDGKAQVESFESLTRWKKDGEFIPPFKFISIAEKTNIIIQMGMWVILTAAKQCVNWGNKFNKNFKIAVNLSANQLMDPNIIDDIIEILEKENVEPDKIEIEITESAIVKNLKETSNILREMKKLGLKIAIDDFGTSYATFNYIKYLPVDKIKIDISFIRGIGKNKIDEAIIISFITLSKNLGIDVIAEGVETKEQLEFLNKHGCYDIQGYYFFKPMAVDDIEAKKIFYYEKKLEL